jgi:hypothetical protein
VQFATEFTSLAAPRTVLQAAVAIAAPIKAAVRIFWTIFNLPNWGGATEDQVALSTAFAAEFTSVAAPRTVLHAAVAREAVINTAVTIL